VTRAKGIYVGSSTSVPAGEPGAAAGRPAGRLARAWATAVNRLGVMAAVLVGVIWLTPVVVLAGAVPFGVRALRRPRPA
jgi:hypothetical protein